MSMIDERIIVGEDVLAHHDTTFSLLKVIEIPPSEEDEGYEQTDYVVQLQRGKNKIIWCQGYPDLCYDYWNEYKPSLYREEI